MITPVCNKWACGLSNTIELGLSRGSLDLRMIGIWIGSGKTFTGLAHSTTEELLVSCGSGSSAAVCFGTGDLEFDVVDVANGSWPGLGAIIVDSSCVFGRSVDDPCTIKKKQQQWHIKLTNKQNNREKRFQIFYIKFGLKSIHICRQIILDRMMCVERRTQKKILSSRWELNPQPSRH